MAPFDDKLVKAVFKKYPDDVRTKLMWLRELIFQTAASCDQVGELEETLKWGQPSYLTSESKSGTTIRIDELKSEPGGYALFVHCQTSLIEMWKSEYGDMFRYLGNRALVFNVATAVPEIELADCISKALRYHLSKRGKRKPIGQQINQSVS